MWAPARVVTGKRDWVHVWAGYTVLTAFDRTNHLRCRLSPLGATDGCVSRLRPREAVGCHTMS
jgi:hypothetical protein